MYRSKSDQPIKLKLCHPIFRIRFTKNPLKKLKKKSKRIRLYWNPDGTYYATSRSLDVLRHSRSKFEIIGEIKPGKAAQFVSVPFYSILHESPPHDVVDEIIAFSHARKNMGKPCNAVYLGRTSDRNKDSFVLDYAKGSRRYHWKWEKDQTVKKTPPVQKQFSRFIEAFSDPDTRTVLSLGSGGLRMFAHSSLLKIIDSMDLREHIDEIWGCSGGAIIGMAYSMGAKPEEIEKEGYRIFRDSTFKAQPTRIEFLKEILLSLFSPENNITVEGILDIRNSLEESLNNLIHRKKPEVPVYTIAYNMNKKQKEILTPTPVKTNAYKGEIKMCSGMNSVLASSAIPILHIPRIIKRGKTEFTYIDGSIFEEVPLQSIYWKWMIDKKYGLTNKKKLLIVASDLFYFASTSSIFRSFIFKNITLLKVFSEVIKMNDRVRSWKIKSTIDHINSDPYAKAIKLNLSTVSRHSCLEAGIIPVSIDRAHNTYIKQLMEYEKLLGK